MAGVAAVTTEQKVGPSLVTAADPGRRKDLRWTAALAAAWLIPLSTHLLGIDIVLPPLIVVGTASLLTIGSTLVDRVVPAAGLVAGASIVGGLLFSVWPWGLAPVPVAGTALTLLAGRAWWLWTRHGRLPSLPRRVLGSDLILVAAAGYGAWLAAAPSLRGPSSAGLGYTTLTGDRMRHFVLFDGIHRTGGYTFLKWSQAGPIIDPRLGKTYPQGVHFLYALVDTFVTGHANPGDAVAELDRYRWYVALGFAFMVLAITWAARWVAGPAVAGWRRGLLCSAVGSWVATGVLTTMLWCTWDPEVVALGLVAVAAAIMARPSHRTGEHLLTSVALVTAVGFAYYLYLPFVWAMAGVAAIVYRRRLMAAWKLSAAAAVIGLPLSALPYALGVSSSEVKTSEGLLTPGFAIATPKSALMAMVVLCALGLLNPTGRRRPTAWTIAGMLGTSAIGMACFAAYQIDEIGFTTYYFQKAMHVMVTLGLIGAGTSVIGLKARPGTTTAPAWRSRWLPGTAAALAGVLLVGGAGLGRLQFKYSDMYTGPDTTWSQVWANGRQIFPVHGAALSYLRSRHLLGDGKPTLVLWDDKGTENRDMTLILAALNHDAGRLGDVVYGMNGVDGLTGVKARSDGTLEPDVDRSLTAVQRIAAAVPEPLRIIVSDRVVAARLTDFAASVPSSKISVVFLPGLPGERSPA